MRSFIVESMKHREQIRSDRRDFTHRRHGHRGEDGMSFVMHGGHDHHRDSRRGTALTRERVLGLLLENEHGMRQKDIAEHTRINASSMSELVDRLEAEGYVTRNVDESDKRATLIALTEKGKARAYELEDSREERLDDVFGNLKDDEKHELIRLIDKLTGR